MTHSPTCALLVHHEPCNCHDTPETPTDRAARLALDLGRARRRIAELEAAEGRVRALHHPVPAPGYDPYCEGCYEAGGYDATPSHPCPTIRALDGPPDDQQDRKAT